MKANALLPDGSNIPFSRSFAVPLPGPGAAFGGSSGKNYIIGAGEYCLSMDLQNFMSEILLKRLGKKLPFFILYPQVGKPFSTEFSTKKPSRITSRVEEGIAILEAMYSSEDRKDISLTWIYRLHPNGRIESQCEIQNRGSVLARDLWVNSNIYIEGEGITLPYDGKILQLPDSFSYDFESLDLNRISGNWMLVHDRDGGLSLGWSKKWKPIFMSWHLSLQQRIPDLKPGESFCTSEIILTTEPYTDWREVNTRFSENKASVPRTSTDILNWQVKNGNPFTGESPACTFTYFHEALEKGTLHLTGQMGNLKETTIPLSEEAKTLDVPVTRATKSPIEVAEVEIDLGAVVARRKTLICFKGTGEVSCRQTEESGKQVYEADNGEITIKASPDFGYSLYSLTSNRGNKTKWLDHSFPEAGPKSWWNPWTGGLFYSFRDLQEGPIQAFEEYTGDFSGLTDNFGNEWKGIRITVDVNRNETYRGLKLEQYFLLLPGVPVLCQIAKIHQNTGKYLKDINFLSHAFIRGNSALKERWFSSISPGGEQKLIRGGRNEIQLTSKNFVTFGGDKEGNENEKSRLHMISRERLHGYVDQEVLKGAVHEEFSLEAGKTWFSSPVFYLIGDLRLDSQALKQLLTLHFI
jgi:hypothetical protein